MCKGKQSGQSLVLVWGQENGESLTLGVLTKRAKRVGQGRQVGLGAHYRCQISSEIICAKIWKCWSSAADRSSKKMQGGLPLSGVFHSPPVSSSTLDDRKKKHWNSNAWNYCCVNVFKQYLSYFFSDLRCCNSVVAYVVVTIIKLNMKIIIEKLDISQLSKIRLRRKMANCLDPYLQSLLCY